MSSHTWSENCTLCAGTCSLGPKKRRKRSAPPPATPAAHAEEEGRAWDTEGSRFVELDEEPPPDSGDVPTQPDGKGNPP